jgi:hypothetical protein
LASFQFSEIRESFVWFALFSGTLGGYIFNFELGRLMGFLKTYAPKEFAALPQSRSFEALAFFSPRLLRPPESKAPHYNAICVYRSAWQFSVVAVFLPLILNWVL